MTHNQTIPLLGPVPLGQKYAARLGKEYKLLAYVSINTLSMPIKLCPKKALPHNLNVWILHLTPIKELNHYLQGDQDHLFSFFFHVLKSFKHAQKYPTRFVSQDD